MQTYANICLLGAVSAYCFTDTGGEAFGKAAKFVALLFVAAFVVTEGIALIA
jgi:hypothetical protein